MLMKYIGFFFILAGPGFMINSRAGLLLRILGPGWTGLYGKISDWAGPGQTFL